MNSTAMLSCEYVQRRCWWVTSGFGSDGNRLQRTVNQIRERLTASEFASDITVRHRAEVLIQRLVDIFAQKVD